MEVEGARNSRGFTLLELLVVVVIIGLLAGFVAPRYFSQVGKSEVNVAKAQIDALEKALDQYRLDVGRYPTTELGLKALVERPASEAKWNGPVPEEGRAARPVGQALPLHVCPARRATSTSCPTAATASPAAAAKTPTSPITRAHALRAARNHAGRPSANRWIARRSMRNRRAARPRAAATPSSKFARAKAWLSDRGERFPLPLFSQELLVLLDAGLPLVEALETLAEKEKRAEWRAVLGEPARRSCARASRSRSALEQAPAAFPPLYVATVRAARRPATWCRRLRATSPTRRSSTPSASAWSTPRSIRCC